MEFLHISNKPTIIDKYNFKCPNLEEYDDRSCFNPKGVLFLSRVVEDSKSYWLKHCENFSTMDSSCSSWVQSFNKHLLGIPGYAHYFKINLEQSKILVIQNEQDIINLVKKWGIFSERESFNCVPVLYEKCVQ